MGKNSIPYIAIIGGFWNLKENNPTKFKEAKKTAEQLGAALAMASMGLVVYLSNDESLEPHVVSGYVANIPPGTKEHLIRVRFAESQKGIVKFAQEATHAELFDCKVVSKQWEASFYRSLVAADEVDGVLLMAGGRSTNIAGQIALAGGLPVLAVDKFEGTATEIRSELATLSKDYPSSATHNPSEMIAWLQEKCAECADQQEEARRREISYLELTSQKQKVYWAICSFIVLLVIVVFGMAQVPAPWFPFLVFVGLIASGATGALVRSIISRTDNTTPTASLLLGGVAGFVVGLAYLVPQWVGAPGVLEPTAKAVQATDKIQFASSLLVSISAGVGFDTVFTRLKQQASDLPISVSGK